MTGGDGRPVAVCLLGAPGDTANLGVSALMESSLTAIAGAGPPAHVTVFDNGFGCRTASLRSGDAVTIDYALCGMRSSRRLHRPESLLQMRLAARLPWIPNAGVRALRRCSSVFDLSGGDSFTDLYGQKRFTTVLHQKLVALATGAPLVLLPQTYGPFSDQASRRGAQKVLRRAQTAWARDEDSFAVLRELLGDDFDGLRHRLGVDVAMALPARRPETAWSSEVVGWVERPGPPVLGFNVSGLIYNDSGARRRFGLRTDYRTLVHRLVLDFLEGTDCRLLLVPHVLAASGRLESDPDACEAVRAQVPTRHQHRIMIATGIREAQEMKWLIARCEAFCGTRMHSTIAALSSGVPAAAIAYSPKTEGVFATVGMGHLVADPRVQSEEEAITTIWSAWEARDDLRRHLAIAVPPVIEQAQAPFAAPLSVAASIPAPSAAPEP